MPKRMNVFLVSSKEFGSTVYAYLFGFRKFKQLVKDNPNCFGTVTKITRI